MHTPNVDIIVPVWNNPFETRACLAAILEHSPNVRLIIVDNASNRETELMLEEFSEALGEQGLFIKTERNLGLVPAINLGLARSDSDNAVIIRPSVQVNQGWLEPLLDMASAFDTGIVTPFLHGTGVLKPPPLAPGCTLMEVLDVSFTALLLKTEMRMLIGTFDEMMDGGEWCLRDYVRRAASKGYRTLLTARTRLWCGEENAFGSGERRQEIARQSRELYLKRWGEAKTYCVYFPPETTQEFLSGAVETMLAAARRGDSFTVILHRPQAAEFRRRGWHGLHSAITMAPVPLLFPARSIDRLLTDLRSAEPSLILVSGIEGTPFPGGEAAIPFNEIVSR